MSRMSRLFFVTISVLLASPALITHPAAQIPLSFAPTGPVQPAPLATADEKEAFAEAERLLQAGEVEAAREAGLLALASYPFSDHGYQLLHKIAVASGDLPDALRWAKWLYWSRKYSGRTKELEELAPLFEGQWEGANKDIEILTAWDEQLRDAAKKAGSKKQYRLAGHLMDRLLELNAGDSKLEKEYAKLADKAGQQLSGGAFVASSIRRKSPEWLARQNKEHEDWKNPFERETDNYRIFTNVSWEFAETVAAAMEEVNAFYRDIYDYRKKARATIFVMRKRSDFDKQSIAVRGSTFESRGVGGFWSPGQRTVVAYDRAYDEEGFTQAALWNTLFHEASHQFMSILSKDRHMVPAWLNEGTASYFEGCEIKPDGSIVKNAPAQNRLRSWFFIDNSDKPHTLEQLIAHERNVTPDENGVASYEGSYYPYGWALVYFLLNYEENDRRVYGQAVTDDGRITEEYKAVKKAGRLVYRDAYAKYLEHFTEKGSGSDRFYALEMAKKYFVDDIKDPDVPDWESFEKRWRKFCTSLYQEQEAGAEFADVLQARSRGYMLAEDWERGRVTAEQADAKRANDPETHRLLALANWGEGRKDDALYWMVRHWEGIYPTGDVEAIETAEDWISSNGGKDVQKGYIEATKLAIEQLAAAADEALDAGEPMAAALFAVHGCEVLNMDHHLLTQHFSVSEAGESPSALETTGLDLRMWQRAFVRSPEFNRTYFAPGIEVETVRYDEDGVFVNNPEGEARPGVERVSRRSLNRLTAPYEIRGAVQMEGEAMLKMGIDLNGRPSATLLFSVEDGKPSVAVAKFTFRVDVELGIAGNILTVLAKGSFPGPQEFDFLLSVNKDEATWISGNGSVKMPFPDTFRSELFEGGIGLDAMEGGVGLWKNIEVRPNRPFWPVP